MIFIPVMGESHVLFIGDSLTYQLAMSYREQLPVNAKYLEGTGLNSTKLFDWQAYIQKINFRPYSAIYIVFGTNDLISQSEVPVYQQKVQRFIKEIKQQNKNVIWILPPSLQNTRKDNLLKNTRKAIISAAYYEGIKIIDMQYILGNDYIDSINGVRIRTTDGIHITKEGADMIVKIMLLSRP